MGIQGDTNYYSQSNKVNSNNTTGDTRLHLYLLTGLGLVQCTRQRINAYVPFTVNSYQLDYCNLAAVILHEEALVVSGQVLRQFQCAHTFIDIEIGMYPHSNADMYSHPNAFRSSNCHACIPSLIFQVCTSWKNMKQVSSSRPGSCPVLLGLEILNFQTQRCGGQKRGNV